jgi:DNA modification methylase
MKIIVLHGDYTTKLYERLNKFIEAAKKRGWEIVNDEINQTPSLFNIERLTILRKYNLLSKKDLSNVSKISGTLVIYNEGRVPQLFLKELPKDTKIEEFKLPKIIWGFLDNISIKRFHEVIKNEPVEFVFSVLAKRFRDLYWLKVSEASLPYQSWQIAKLKRQAQNYTLETLKKIIDKLAEIDVKVKTSKADLISELDLMLIKSLE